jgi:hypothetical protein
MVALACGDDLVCFVGQTVGAGREEAMMERAAEAERNGKRAELEVYPAIEKGHIDGRLTMLPIDMLMPGESPRIEGVDIEHSRLLAMVKSDLPPIIVHRSTGRVIDGMHRLTAARLRGDDMIAVEYFDGSETDAFIHAVRANVRHGLPLSRAAREAAAVRVITLRPEWSDRAIADVTGLSAPAVGNIRRRSTDASFQSNTRVGRDGRVRPLNSTQARRKAGEIVAERPHATLREIAKESGISLATARDVRERVRHGDDPVPSGLLERHSVGTSAAAATARLGGPDGGPSRRTVTVDRSLMLQHLRKDPSLRLSQIGRSLLQWLGVYVIHPANIADFADSIPKHSAPAVADLARGCAEIWLQLADALEAGVSQRDAG